jgi:uncharacterized protein with NAD-binding domain and iron-sulfur cluster
MAKKLAILGGGVGSMSAAFEITNNPNWRDTYESITVYQMGWRIGGKGASGRRAPYGSIEEHGLHIWLGFYNNAFDAIQRAYKEMDRPKGAPLATWTDAFKKHDLIVFAQNFKDKWYPWNFDFPENDRIPGKGDPLPSLWDYLGLTLGWVKQIITQPEYRQHFTTSNAPQHEGLLARLKEIVKDGVLDVELGTLTIADDLINVAIAHHEKMGSDVSSHDPDDHSTYLNILQEIKAWLIREFEKKVESDLELTRFFILVDTGLTGLIGMISDGVLFHPQKLDSLDKEDLREWFLRHGAADITAYSPLMQGLYDLVFAYENGEVSKPNFAAGTAIRCIFRIVFTYKGAIFWKMQAGMGDTIFTPLHKVLTKRGVKFKFFHKVTNLGLSADKTAIDTISIQQQATVKDGKDYDPYVNILDLDCWPAEPNYDQLVEGEELKAKNINLESFYTTWTGVTPPIPPLKRGVDFDDVLFGLSVGPVPYICSELMINDNWSKMVDYVGSVRTMAFQAWLNKDLVELGWEEKSPVMDAFVEPMNTWADMSQLIDKETWPASDNIKNVSYFCGPMEGGIPPQSKVDEPKIALDTVTQVSNEFFDKDMNVFWPKNVDRDGHFDWGSVVSTFYRANIDPSERYVLSLKGSTQYRLDGGKSGFSNLYLAGDWVVCGLNAGCVEASVISGMLASNAMVGYPALDTIDGHQDI